MVFMFGVGSAFLSWGLTSLVRRYALAHSVLDVPNERSSHHRPTPRGGGLGMIIPITGTLMILPLWGLSYLSAGATAVAVAIVAVLGWVDDHRSLSIRIRMAGHVVAGALVTLAILVSGQASLNMGLPMLLACLWWVFWTVSAINVVNFIDGIDGIIALQAMIFGMFSLAVIGSVGTPASILALVLVGAAGGFLILNWAPAKIFMGDVGSGGLGVTFVILGALTMGESGSGVVRAFLPLMPIFVDEVLTMLRRISRGERLSEPHRTHVYQLLVQAGWGHGPVAALYGALAFACGVIALRMPIATSETWIVGGALLIFMCTVLVLLRSRAERHVHSQPVA